MKKTITACLLFLMTLNNSFAGDKETIIDRINNSDSIPVYIVHGSVIAQKYNPTFGKVQLTTRELSQPHVNTTMPVEIDTLHSFLVQEMNNQFKTTKFYVAATGNETEITDIILNESISFSVVIEFKADYDYEYLKPVIREAMNLVAYQTVSLTSIINFYIPKGKDNELKKVESALTGTRTTFQLKRYVNDANALVAEKSPLVLAQSFKAFYTNKMVSIAEKQFAKQEKAASKN